MDGLGTALDLGGLRRRDGSRTPRGVCFRSENVDCITAAGIRTIVDLRQPGALDHDRGRLPICG